ncbi:uncharacterized protein LOC135839312 isoform X2 [Planococcus citri]|uniref:uncharacterized protein LOC135839312 isoform X2 n=1 Tax=Planococcus citri TaxID=170843 RepID=UPI0031F876A9
MIYLLLPLFFTVIESLRDVVVDIPAAVTPGETVVMTCTYDLEGDDLYSVKWYKGRQEFYRYVPKELPHIKVFPMLGINVDISQSGPTKVTLREVHWELSGKYRCEVSTDAPYFHTQVVGSHMHVVKAPSGKPSLRLEKTHYGLGETVRGNCSSPISSPASNITWLVNNKKFFSVLHSSSQSNNIIDRPHEKIPDKISNSAPPKEQISHLCIMVLAGMKMLSQNCLEKSKATIFHESITQHLQTAGPGDG